MTTNSCIGLVESHDVTSRRDVAGMMVNDGECIGTYPKIALYIHLGKL